MNMFNRAKLWKKRVSLIKTLSNILVHDLINYIYIYIYNIYMYIYIYNIYMYIYIYIYETRRKKSKTSRKIYMKTKYEIFLQ